MSKELDHQNFVSSVTNENSIELSWGKIAWLVGTNEMPGAEQTFGVVTIYPNQRNPLHAHPNCEELLYVVSGTCDHKLGDKIYQLTPGSIIRIPRGVPHWAKCTSIESLVVTVAFSSPDRRTDSYKGDEVA